MAPKYQQLRSEIGRKGLRILADVNVRDLQLGLVQIAPVNRDAWLAEISRRILGIVALPGAPSRWHDPDYRESTVRAALWLYDERQAIHEAMGVGAAS